MSLFSSRCATTRKTATAILGGPLQTAGRKDLEAASTAAHLLRTTVSTAGWDRPAHHAAPLGIICSWISSAVPHLYFQIIPDLVQASLSPFLFKYIRFGLAGLCRSLPTERFCSVLL